MKHLTIVLALFVGLSTGAFAAGPSIEPGPETELKVSADLLAMLSDAGVAENLHTAAARHAVKLTGVFGRLRSTETADYTFKFKNAATPPTYANFVVKAGVDSTGNFTVLDVGPLNVAEPVIEPLPFGRP